MHPTLPTMFDGWWFCIICVCWCLVQPTAASRLFLLETVQRKVTLTSNPSICPEVRLSIELKISKLTSGPYCSLRTARKGQRVLEASRIQKKGLHTVTKIVENVTVQVNFSSSCTCRWRKACVLCCLREASTVKNRNHTLFYSNNTLCDQMRK